MSLAVTPFTGGVSTIAGIIGIVKSIHTIADESAKLALSAEQFIGKLAGELGTLQKQYNEVSKTVVGSGELGKATVNSLVGPFFTTISGAKADSEQAESKNNGLDVRANDQAQKLGKLLTEQQKLQSELSAYERSAKAVLNPAEIQKLLAVHKNVELSAKPIDGLIKSIQALHTRIERNKGALTMLKGAMNELAAREPTWSKVGQILVKVASSAAFMIAGGVNAPEPMECYKLAHTVAENSSRVLESLQAAYEAGEGLNELVKKHK